MKRILFLTDMWSPQATANSVCVKNIANVLKRRNWEVYVDAFEGKTGQQSEVIDGIFVEYTRPGLSRQLLTRAKFIDDSIKKRIMITLGVWLNRVIRILNLPYYPVADSLFVKRWSDQVIKRIQKDDIDIVISVNAPTDSIAAGYLVKRKCPKVKWVAYYIDGGTNYGKEQNFLKIKKSLQNKAVKWENKILEIADAIVVMEGHSQYYKKMLNESNRSRLKILNVPLFCQNQIQRNGSTAKGRDKEIWTYMGTIREKCYNPERLLSWFLWYSSIHEAELHLYGATDIEDYLQTKCDGKHIFYHGFISHDQVTKILADSDVLIYFVSEKLDSVSGKFFEYLMYGKPIVYFGPKEDINWLQLEKYPLGLAIDQDTGEQTKSFEEILNKSCSISEDVLTQIFYTSTPDAFADAIEEMETEG